MKRQISKPLFALFLILSLILLQGCNDDDPATAQSDDADSDSGLDDSNTIHVDAGDDESVLLSVEFDSACQLSGKWISNQRTLNIALNGKMKQAGHNWAYWEFEQSGTEVTVKKGLKCGVEIIERSEPSYSQVIADPPVWDAITKNVFNTGRKGVYGLSESGECFLSLEKFYLVRGATVSHFINPDVLLDDARTKAEGTTPGWEDWDQDGNPGITFRLVGVATGALYVAQREWTEYFGPTEKNADSFTLQVRWNNEQVVIDQDPEGLPSADSWPAPEPSEHFVVFVRVDNLKNADGSNLWDVAQDADDLDLTICEKMREVKDELFDHPVIQEDLELKAGD
jgi:hypothetical protein